MTGDPSGHDTKRFVRPLPSNPNLDKQRKLAKRLARAYWRGKPEAIERVRATRAAEDTLARARHYGQRAIDALGMFAPSAAKDAMVEAVEFAVARAY